ncbi:MAG TPA: class I SAM-dependent methyltransferase [Gemmatimonadales bacterium]|nr:class I SAM-dependent methyltransferase [Gemmatimonadales bacterium]
MKHYDRSYFDKWYRDSRTRMWSRVAVERKVRMVLGVAEFLLDRRVRSVLDVGCGEGSWYPILRRMRPHLRYQGVDSSVYAVRRFGALRNIRLGSLAELGSLRLRGPFDLVVCCDVLHYVPTAELRHGLRVLKRLAGGPMYLEAYTTADDIAGDDVDFQRRGAATYRRLFREAGLVACGMHIYCPARMRDQLVALEMVGDR